MTRCTEATGKPALKYTPGPRESSVTTSFSCDLRLHKMLSECVGGTGWYKSPVVEAALLVFLQAPHEWQLEAMKRAASFRLDHETETADLVARVKKDAALAAPELRGDRSTGQD
jgi:hypothetical protein